MWNGVIGVEFDTHAKTWTSTAYPNLYRSLRSCFSDPDNFQRMRYVFLPLFKSISQFLPLQASMTWTSCGQTCRLNLNCDLLWSLHSSSCSSLIPISQSQFTIFKGLTLQNLTRLQPKEWLDDELINSGIKYVLPFFPSTCWVMYFSGNGCWQNISTLITPYMQWRRSFMGCGGLHSSCFFAVFHVHLFKVLLMVDMIVSNVGSKSTSCCRPSTFWYPSMSMISMWFSYDFCCALQGCVIAIGSLPSLLLPISVWNLMSIRCKPYSLSSLNPYLTSFIVS